MIHSMTAFSRQEIQSSLGKFVWEIRSINHRYLECTFKLPEPLNELEPALRDLLKRHVHRGKIEVFLRLKNDSALPKITINQTLLAELVHLNQELLKNFDSNAVVNTFDLLSWPGVIELPEKDNADLAKTQALTSFEAALIELVAMRSREGQALGHFIQQRLQLMMVEIAKAQQRAPLLIQNQRIRLQQKLADLSANIDPLRLEQEIVLFAHRLDVAEELSRLETHIKEVGYCLEKGGTQGRRLDFLMQELNREANTLAAKAGDIDVTSAALELKVLIEQMREQVQNIE